MCEGSGEGGCWHRAITHSMLDHEAPAQESWQTLGAESECKQNIVVYFRETKDLIFHLFNSRGKGQIATKAAAL